MNGGNRVALTVAFFIISMIWATTVTGVAQELDARAYSAAPVGTTIVLAGFGGSRGDVLLDPSIDVAALEADLKVVTTGLGYTFGLAGRQARVLIVAPIAWGTFTGEVASQPARQDVRGFVDPRIKLSVALAGASALRSTEFASARRGTIVGASLTLMAPVGRFESSQIVNLGYNRWAFKPEIGASRTIRGWTVEGHAGVWLFTTNSSYFPGTARREQDPLLSLQSHVSRPLSRRAWVGLLGTWFAGGQTTVDGVPSPDRQRNTRLGLTVSIPVGARHSIRFLWSTGAVTRRGSDFDSVSATWQAVRF